MNIDDFITSSDILLAKGHFESALCLVCCAIDACARSKYGDKLGNKRRICKFITEYMPIITQTGMPARFSAGCKFQFGKHIIGLKTDDNGFAGLEDILYFCIRCSLIHEAHTSPSLVFTDKFIFTYRDGTIILPRTLIFGLSESIKAYRREQKMHV